MQQHNHIRVIFCFVVLSFFCIQLLGCGKPAHDKIIGKWECDIEKMKNLPSIKDDPMAELGMMVLSGMKFEFTKDKVKANVMGEETERNYKVISESKNEIRLDDEMTIRIIDATHIILSTEDTKSQSKDEGFYLIKVG